jgi:aminoglycoside phosphotransferase (APT) family kinase protein
VIHGDANVGNLLCDDAGTARLADLDGFSIGPREWDLILTAMYYDRYGWHTEEEYRAFVEAYGFDVMAWDGYETMADLRELLMVVWLADTAATDKSGRPELAARLDSIRNNTSRRHWRPR